MSKSEFLRMGDVFTLTTGMRVEATVPKSYVFTNRRDSDEFSSHGVKIGEPLTYDGAVPYETSYLAGEYLATDVASLEDGFRVAARKLDSDGNYDQNGHLVVFYQSGSYRSMILPGDISAHRRMKQAWVPI